MKKGEISAQSGSVLGGKNKKKTPKRLFLAILIASIFLGGMMSIEKVQAAGTLVGGQACSEDTEQSCKDSCASGVGRDEYSPHDGGRIGWICVGNAPTTAVPATSTQPQTKHFNYTLLESFPGFFQAKTEMTDLPAMILAIYKFGIWTVGIAGFFMLVVGGFMYMASAGNTSAVGSARKIIADALLGIVAALGAYLILYVINPELTKIKIDFTTVEVIETLGYGEGGGTCAVPTTGPCTVENLQKTCFGANAKAAAMVCGYESGGTADSKSKTDIGADGNVFSWGLFQINLTQHSLGGLDCESAFNGKNYSSKVKNPSTYDKCKAVANTASININYACKISNNGTNWKPWANTKKACGL